MIRWLRLIPIPLLALLAISPQGVPAEPPVRPDGSAPTSKPAATVRVAAIGGINDAAFWKALSERFEHQTGIRVQTVVTGNKDAVGDLFKRGGIDLITVQSAEAVTDLVANGYASDPQPWVKTELIIVGPPQDPAGIKGLTDAPAAIKRIIASKSAFVVHASLGADEVVRRVVESSKGPVADSNLLVLLDDHQKRVLQIAADKHAYTLIARAPFVGGKIPAGGLVALVEGDPVLRRPFVFAVANPQNVGNANVLEAQRLAEFLVSDETQSWIEHWRQDQPGDRQEFFPVRSPAVTKAASDVLLRITGDVDHRVAVTPAIWATLPKITVSVPGRDGAKVEYHGVNLRDLLRLADVPLGGNQLRGAWLNRTVHVRAADGYEVAFSLAELDGDSRKTTALLVDLKGDVALPAGEGPLRLVVPGETPPARWVKHVTELDIR